MTYEKRTLGSAIFADIDSNAYLGKLYARLLKGYGMHLFNPNEYHTPRELRQLINQYVDDYNGIRPHEALGYEVPDKLYFNRFAA